MRRVITEKEFIKGLKRQKKRGKDHRKLEAIVALLINDISLPYNAHPHKLKGEWQGLWECHIESDWLLIYGCDDETITLSATGTHQDLFKKY